MVVQMRNALSLIKELTVELEAMRTAANSYKMHNEKLVEELYVKGYRKASEVAEEIFSVVDETIEMICFMTGLDITIFGKYAGLKKKYTEGR